MCRFAAAVGAAVWLLGASSLAPARADVLINIDKSSQRMTVSVDGSARYSWAISTGLGGGPPSGGYRPERLERKWFSHKYGWSPMPHSIFFHKGYAIHGTIYLSRLGTRASHGCVRLHPDHAAILFDLVRNEGMANTRIVVGNGAAEMSAVAAPARPVLKRKPVKRRSRLSRR